MFLGCSSLENCMPWPCSQIRVESMGELSPTFEHSQQAELGTPFGGSGCRSGFSLAWLPAYLA